MYLRGRQYLRATGAENFEHARQMFRRAVELDPAFAEARAGIADAGANLLQWLLLPKENQPALRAEVLAESDEALRLKPDLAEAHVARGSLLSVLGKNAEADQSFRRATALAPGLRDAWYFYARFLFAAGKYPDSAAAYEEAAKRDPDDYQSLNLLSMPYYKLGQPEKALDALKRALEAADRVLKTKPDDVRALYLSAGALIQLGEVRKGMERLNQAVALEPHDFAVLYNAACGYARAGESGKALDLLDRAVGTGQGFRGWMEKDPDLDPVRGSPRFQQILARLPH
jgi:tetratricopeptide (TPR) repeat protein